MEQKGSRLKRKIAIPIKDNRGQKKAIARLKNPTRRSKFSKKGAIKRPSSGPAQKKISGGFENGVDKK